MVGEIKPKVKKHCSKCGCIFVNYDDPDKCPMCDEKYTKIRKDQMGRILGQS